MQLVYSKRLLTDKELEYYLSLDPKKQKKYLEGLNKELFETKEYERRLK